MPTGSLKYRILAVCHDPEGNLKLAEAIKRSPGWCKYFKSVWLVATTETPKTLYDRLRPSMASDESILITEVGTGTSYYGFMPQDAWDWIKEVRATTPPQSSTG